MWNTNDSYNILRLDQLPSGWILASATKIKKKKKHFALRCWLNLSPCTDTNSTPIQEEKVFETFLTRTACILRDTSSYCRTVKLCRRTSQFPTFWRVLILKDKQIVYSLTLNMNLLNAENHSSKDKTSHLAKLNQRFIYSQRNGI